MLVLETLTVTNLTYEQRALTWTIESTTETIADYTLNIYRAEYSPQTDVLSNMTLIDTAPAEDYSYIDTITGYETNAHREFYYAIEPVNESTEAIGDYIGPTTVAIDPDNFARVAIHRQAVGFRLTGQSVAILKKRTFGTFCPTCFDITLGRRTQTNCSTCYDTGFTGGYFSQITVNGIINATPKRQIIVDWGSWQPMDAIITLPPYPVISPDDLIVDKLNRRWVVVEIRPTSKALALITQNCRIRMVPRDDIAYTIAVTL